MSEPVDHVSRPESSDPKRRFLYVTEVDLSVDNGPGINEREFVQALTEHWPDVVTCVAPSPSHPGVYTNPEIHYVAGHGRRALGYPRFIVSARATIRRLCAQQDVDAIVFRFGVTPLIPYWVTKVGDVPVMLKTFVPQGALGPEMRLSPLREGLLGLLGFAYRRVVSSALAADTVSIPYRDWICARFEIPPERITVIPNGANTDVFSPGDREAAKRKLGLDRFDHVVGYVGALSKIRYVDLLIQATRRLALDGSVGLVLVGEGAERLWLEELARAQGLSDQVVFIGGVPYSRVCDFVRAFDVAVDLTAVQMEIDNRTVLSSFSQKIPQYLACGVPVVAWRCGDTEFLAEADVGGLATFHDEPDLAQVLATLLERPLEERERRRDRARRVAQTQLSTVKLAGDRLDLWRAALVRQLKSGVSEDA